VAILFLKSQAPIRASNPVRRPLARGHEDTAAVEASALEVVHGIVDGVERVALGTERHSTLRRQGHELDEIVVGADKVAEEVDLGRDDVDRWHLEQAEAGRRYVRSLSGTSVIFREDRESYA